MIDALTRTTIVTPDRSANFGEPAFANVAIGLIGSVVSEIVLLVDASLLITFDGGGTISISPRPADTIGPEAAIVHGHNQQLEVL